MSGFDDASVGIALSHLRRIHGEAVVGTVLPGSTAVFILREVGKVVSEIEKPCSIVSAVSFAFTEALRSVMCCDASGFRVPTSEAIERLRGIDSIELWRRFFEHFASAAMVEFPGISHGNSAEDCRWVASSVASAVAKSIRDNGDDDAVNAASLFSCAFVLYSNVGKARCH